MATKKQLIITDLLEKSIKQLLKIRNDLKKELFDHKLALSLRKLNNTHLIASTRKNIARIETCIRQKITR